MDQLLIQAGASAAMTPWPSLPLIVSIMFTRAKAATAGAVVYRIAMKNSAQPADLRASDTFGTVKKRTMTCGRPAVPTIRAAVMQNTSIVLFDPLVYSANPSSVLSPLSLSRRCVPLPSRSAPKPVCGSTWPVSIREMKIAGTM